MLQIRLLGQFDVRSAGRRIDIPSRAGQSLLAYLILNAGTPQRRERLAGLLWPNTSDENARHNLRTELWRIRKALGSRDASNNDYLLTEDLTITFNPEAQCWLDVTQLQRSTTADGSLDDLIGQLMLYQGELLPGFYDDWIVLERERLQAVFERDMKRLLERLCQEQRWATVLEWSERWIALGQTPEPAYRALMAAYAALGDRAKAMATFERCRAALDRELAVEPSPETQVLYDRLLRGETIASVDLSATQIAAVHARLIEEPPAPGKPPFKGLPYFDEADADLFFGRELLTAQLIEQVRESNFLAVIVGASGSGKSSIVRAGLIPALKRDQPQWIVHIITPTAHPLEALATTLTRGSESVTATATLLDDLTREPRSLTLFSKRLLKMHSTPRLLLVIDQFEELFTLCRDEFERVAFIDNLLAGTAPSPTTAGDPLKGAGGGGSGCITLILTLRADFYAHLAQYPELRQAVARQQEFIGPMTANELRRAIEEPAKRSGWEFEPGLVDLILRDVGDEPGALPLLSHALLETWQRRSGRTMTLKGYADAGGVRGAIAYTAETVYQQLTAEQQELARHIFLELTELGEGTEDTRRRVNTEDLITRSDQIRPLLTTLADARLITTSVDTVEVAHEALIREWPRLRNWLDEDREGLRLHRHLSEAAHDWELLERDLGALYRGARLSQAREWAEANFALLSAAERDFLTASNQLEQREAAEREAQRQRELEAALALAATQQQAAKRLRRRNRVIAVAGALVTLAFIVAVILGGQAYANATRADRNAAQAQRQTRVALSRQLAAQAVTQLDTDYSRALLLAVAAEQIEKTGEARSGLLATLQHLPLFEAALHGHTRNVWTVAFSPDGKTLASGGDDETIILWDVTDPRTPVRLGVPLTGHADAVLSMAFSPDSKLLASGSADTTIKLWDVSNLFTVKQLSRTLDEGTGAINSVAFSPDGKLLVSGRGDGAVILWDVVNPGALTQLGTPLTGHRGAVDSVAFSRDGKMLVSGSSDGTLILWNVTNPHAPTRLGSPLNGNSGGVRSVAISPDGKTLASGFADRTIILWDVTNRLAPTRYSTPLPGYSSIVGSMAFSPDGKILASGGTGRTIILWDVTNPGTPTRLGTPLAGHVDAVLSLAFSPDGKTLASGSADKTIFLWNMENPHAVTRLSLELITVQADRVTSIAFSPRKTLASGSGSGMITLWDATNPQAPAPWGAPLIGHTDAVWSLAFRPDGQTMASGSADNTIRLWDVTNPRAPTPLGAPLTGHTDRVWSVAFSPNGETLASGSADDTIRLWDVADPRAPAQLGAPLIGHTRNVLRVTFSPDGKTLASGSIDTKIILWDVSNPRAPTQLGPPLSGHTGAVQSVVFSPDGMTLASGSDDGTIVLWDVTNPRLPRQLSAPLAGYYGWTQNFDTAEGGLGRVAFFAPGAIRSMAYSSEGNTLAAGSADGAITLWDVTDPRAPTRLEAPLIGHTGSVFSIAFDPDGQMLASGGAEGKILFWDVNLKSWQTRACQIAGRNFTHAEWRHYFGDEPYRIICEQWPAGLETTPSPQVTPVP